MRYSLLSNKKAFLAMLIGAGWALLVTTGTACSSKDPADGNWIGDDVTRNDFEAVAGWGGADRSTLTREHAHSGRYAVLVDSTHETGLMFDLPLYEASVHTLLAVEVEAWVYLPHGQADAVLQVETVAEGAAADAPHYSEQLPLLSQVSEYKKWTRVQHIFHLPNGLPGSTHLRLYLKRGTNPGPVYLDDIRVKAREW
jgi:hypothetical protein